MLAAATEIIHPEKYVYVNNNNKKLSKDGWLLYDSLKDLNRIFRTLPSKRKVTSQTVHWDHMYKTLKSGDTENTSRTLPPYSYGQ